MKDGASDQTQANSNLRAGVSDSGTATCLGGGAVNKWQDRMAPPRIAYHQVRISFRGEVKNERLAT